MVSRGISNTSITKSKPECAYVYILFYTIVMEADMRVSRNVTRDKPRSLQSIPTADPDSGHRTQICRGRSLIGAPRQKIGSGGMPRRSCDSSQQADIVGSDVSAKVDVC
jgi:hypothetical protein